MSNFQCPQCGMVNIDCGKEGYKTPKELKYEKTLEEIEGILQMIVESNKVYPLQSNLYKTLNIISNARKDNHVK